MLELWDEEYWGDFQRIHTTQDTAIDLQYDLSGIIAFALAGALILKALEKSRQRRLPIGSTS
jgi:hypothetical protein